MKYDNGIRGKTIGKSTLEEPMEKSQWESIDISDEEVRKQLDERGCKAERGDSPYPRYFYEEANGIRKD